MNNIFSKWFCKEQEKQVVVGRNNQQYFAKQYKPDYSPKSKQSVVRLLSYKEIEKVRKAEQDEMTGKPNLMIVRKTVDDSMSRTVEFGRTSFEVGLNHERIWNRDYSRDLGFVLYVLGFNNRGVVNGTWMHNHYDDINKFLMYMENIGCSFDWNPETNEFRQMLWSEVKSASWLLFHAGCYRGKPQPCEFADDLFVEANKRAIELNLQDVAEVSVAGKKVKSDRYSRPPTAAQVAYANQIYRRLQKAGYASIGRPDLTTFGTTGRFIGTWQTTYHNLGYGHITKEGISR